MQIGDQKQIPSPATHPPPNGETTTTSRHDGVKEWVEQLREVAFQIEDAIHEYLLHKEPQNHHHQHGLFINSLHRIGHSILNMKACHHIASQINKIRSRILEIKERSLRYGFYYATIVNDDDQQKGCKMWFSSKHPLGKSQLERTVVSVVGMGGMGNTTLAKRVYDRVVAKLDCHARITVCKSYYTGEDDWKNLPLPLDKTWQLFCNKAFQFEFARYCPAELENLSDKIAKRCEGLPLVIVAIAGLLYGKEKTVLEW
ncbi:uncharacterized protein LOC132803106 [Ziziphus jujuba]|uniref:Uncharacterized protein LOC132803106 n=1 Tax=Ziziphus jujuba TaxID=326968 RepID=A0ABM4A3M0_ZIZJJ|nr:uncharacterized protein LOC132803106 [Ziziphus jujuba]